MKKNRCFKQDCNRKLKWTECFKCKCERIYCFQHKLSIYHDCTFDYKKEYELKLNKQNVKFENKKIEFI